MTGVANQKIKFPIIDAHIHLYAQDHIKDLAWSGALSSTHVLNRQHSVAEYRAASSSQPTLVGFVFVETDRKSDLSEDGWTHPFEELDFLKRIRAGTPRAREGHAPEDKSLILGAIPWAPLPTDPFLFNKYLDQANCDRSTDIDTASQTDKPTTNTSLIKGFRYLLQDKPPQTQLSTPFTTNLLTLQAQGLKTFDLGIDFHRAGPSQLQDSITMLTTFYASSPDPPTLHIVLNHLCKPDICTTDPASLPLWSSLIRRLASFPTTTMKLSGLFSEIPEKDPTDPRSTVDYLDLIRPFTRVIFECFGPQRIMFGSDWPVCSVGGPGLKTSWECWVSVVAAVLEDEGCDEEEKGRVWAGTANEVYGLGVDLEGLRG